MDGAVPDEHLRTFAEASRGDVEFLLKHGVAVGEVMGYQRGPHGAMY